MMFLETPDPKDSIIDQAKYRVIPSRITVQSNLEFHVIYLVRNKLWGQPFQPKWLGKVIADNIKDVKVGKWKERKRGKERHN